MKENNINTISCEDTVSRKLKAIKKWVFLERLVNPLTSFTQPHQRLRQDLRILAVAKLGDEELLDKIIKQR